MTYKDENGLRLGTWLTALRGNRRYGTREKFLTPERIEMLDKIGMVWDITSYSWDKYYSSAARYYEEHGDLKVPANYIDSDGVYLGKWITRLKAIRRGESPNSRDLTEEQIERLDKIGMVWERQRDKNWDKMFQELCTYYEEYHTFQFSEFDKSDKKNELPRWCARQRELYKVEKLSEERIAKLKSINFPFDGVANESLLRAEEMKTWELKFQAAKAYYVEHGDLNIPSDFKVNGYYLSVWINEQRLLIKGNRRKKLTEEQIEKLASIGICTNEKLIDEKWNEKYEIAKKYFLQYGDLNIPYNLVYEGVNLSKWVLYQRSRYKSGKLPQECYDKLSSIGMVWEIDTEYKYEDNYNTGFQHLEEYIRENGVESITENTICSDGYKLGIWVGNCRSKYRNGVLKKRYIERFQALGIDLGEIKGEASYEKGFQHLEEFIREHGVESLTNSIICSDGYKLGVWYGNCKIKFRKGTMKPCYVERFASLGVRLEEVRDEIIEQQYETGFQHLEDFIRTEGLAALRKYTVCSDGYKLGQWLSNCRVRQRQGVLKPYYVERFLALGINITDSKEEIYKRGYETGFQHLEEEIRKNGLTSITEKTICDDGFKLGIWIAHCRGNYKKGTLKESYAERLQALGIILNIVETQYETGFQHLEEYIHTYGLAALTQKSVCSDGYKLGNWFGNCKRKYKSGTMEQQYIDRFAALGIDFDKRRQGI